jgi:hypothetical protein
MQRRPFVIITTRLAPQLCGIGTFSWLLDRHWPGDTSRHEFLVVDGAVQSRLALKDVPITEFGADAAKLSHALEQKGSVDVLLHYAGRGYHRLGCPIWLGRALRAWKQKFPSARLTIFFHEVPGKLPLTSPHYWLNLCNLRIIRQLARIGDVLITNTTHHAATLAKISGRTDIHWFSVGSNIEPAGGPSRTTSRTEFVIFGLPYGRWETLQIFHHHICSWQKTGLLTKLHLIGPRDKKFDLRSARLIHGYPDAAVVIQHGELSAAKVSRLLYRSQFGLTNANDLTWSKSTALMAYLAHDCSVVTQSKFNVEPLSFAFAPDEVAAASDVELCRRTTVLRHWFEDNADWKILARKVFDLVEARPTT